MRKSRVEEKSGGKNPKFDILINFSSSIGDAGIEGGLMDFFLACISIDILERVIYLKKIVFKYFFHWLIYGILNIYQKVSRKCFQKI